MANNIIKILRSIVAGNRPAGHLYGEPYVNLSDNQFGVFDSSNTPRDLIGVPVFSSATSYSVGQPVNYQGRLYLANTSITPGAFNPTQWNLMVSGTLGTKNYILNGAMMVSQQYGALAGSGSGYYAVDQFYAAFSGTTGVYTAAQVASPTPSGSPNRLRVVVTTADASVAAGDIVWIQHDIEGLRVADLRFGSASAKTVTIKFGVKAPAGIYSVSIQNNATNRSYVAEYVVAAGEANTDVYKSVTIPGDVTGTWTQDNTAGLRLRWSLMTGSTYQATPGAWNGTAVFGSINQFNFMGTINNTFELYDVGLYNGAVAPTFVVPDYFNELRLCQRYYFVEQLSGTGARWGSITSGFLTVPLQWPVPMRVSPTINQAYGGAVRGTDAQWTISTSQSGTTGAYYASLNSDMTSYGGVIGIIAPTSIPTTLERPQMVAITIDGSARM